jgi:hypothetical protein
LLTVPLAQRRLKQEVETNLFAPIRYHLRAEPKRYPDAGIECGTRKLARLAYFMIAADFDRGL